MLRSRDGHCTTFRKKRQVACGVCRNALTFITTDRQNGRGELRYPPVSQAFLYHSICSNHW